MVHHPDDTGQKRRPGQAGKDKSPGGDRPFSKERPFAKDRPFKKDEPAGKEGAFARDGKPGRPGKFADKGGKLGPKGKDAKGKDAKGKPEKPSGRGERIAKALARAGVASRRDVEKLISLGKIAINGRIIDSPATFVQRDDILTVGGKVVDSAEATRVWRFHKPVGLVTTNRDPEGRPTVFDALPKGLPRVISVGRLDLNSEGLLLFTNDGELSRALELPSTELSRTYRVRAQGRIDQAGLDRLKDGIEVDGVRYGSIEAKLDKAKEKEGASNLWITVSLNEGKYREIRKVFEAIGLRVNRLIRLAYGPFQLGTLGVGELEEVGPRVIREQLAQWILPENLPTGDKVLTPPPAPSRRPVPKSAMANPKAKPSRVKAHIAAREAEEAERAAQGPRSGWEDRPRRGAPYRGAGEDRPKGKRDFKSRESGPREDRGDRPYRPRGEGGGDDRPKKPYRPRAEGDERPRGPRAFKPRDGERSERPEGRKPGWAKPRAGDERPHRPRADRPYARDGAKRPYKPRDGEGEGKGGFRPRAGARPDDDRPARPREEGGGKPFRGKPGGKPGGFKRGPASRGEGKPVAKPGGFKPRGPGGPRPGGPKGPRKPRP